MEMLPRDDDHREGDAYPSFESHAPFSGSGYAPLFSVVIYKVSAFHGFIGVFRLFGFANKSDMATARVRLIILEARDGRAILRR